MMLACDVLVVGAGPAGASAARAAAAGGARTVLLDRRHVIGTPVQCAEYVPIQLLGEVELGADCLAQQIAGMKTFISGTFAHLTESRGYMVNRDRFDRTLVEQAVAAGAELLPGVHVLGREADGTVLARRRDDAAIMHCKAAVIIGADGPRSTVGRWVGASNRNLLPGVQVTVPLREACAYTETYFEPDFYAGYGWFFPKNDRVNIGLGLRRPVRPETLGRLLRRFVAGFVRDGRVEDHVLSRAGGWIPAESLRSGVYGNVLLAGDAAGQTHPITGAGIFAAIVCGRMAGAQAAEAALAGDCRLLVGYDAQWQGLFGGSLRRASERRAFMESAWHDFEPTVRRSWVAFREYYAR